MSDDTDSNVINLPTRGSDSGGMPDAPDGGDLFYSEPPDSGSGGVPPESPAETTMELPAIRGPISPETALRETGMPSAPDSDDGEYGEGGYVQPRSLADRLGDWLEYCLEVARERHAGEAPFRDAEIARKVALLEARTAQETAMMEHNSKLHTAQMKAKADKAAARGKADAARSFSPGMGTDKGGRSKAGGGGGSRGSGGSGRGGGWGSGTNGSGGTGRGSGSGNSPKGTGKGSERSAGGRWGGSKGNESLGGSKGLQSRSGGSGAGKSGTGKASSGGSGGSGRFGSGKGDGGRTQHSPASNARAERAGGRQERAAARQAARQQRRSADQAANLADRGKGRDQARANRQAEREERRAVKAERKAKREAAKAAGGRTTLGEAVTEEAQRRWDQRRAAEKDKAAKDGKAEDSTKEMPKGGPESPSNGPDDGSAAKGPGEGKKGGEKPSDGSGDTDPKDGTGTDDSGESRSFKERFKERFGRSGEAPDPGREEPRRRARPEDFGHMMDRPDRPDVPSDPPKADADGEDVVDAIVIDDPADPFGAHVSRPAGLPPAPKPHTHTTRPTAQEDPVASKVSKPTSGQAGLAAQHRTNITFDEYLMEMANIALASASDQEQAEAMAEALGRVADALRVMAGDLVGDHNIDTAVTNLITNLADAAARMKQQAEACASECGVATEAAKLAAVMVAGVYGQDMNAMDEAGLTYASAAAHH